MTFTDYLNINNIQYYESTTLRKGISEKTLKFIQIILPLVIASVLLKILGYF